MCVCGVGGECDVCVGSVCVCVGEDNKEIIEHSLLWLAGLSRGQRSSPPGPAVVTAPTSFPFLSPLF